MHHISLPYGTDEITLTIPSGEVQVLHPEQLPPLSDLQTAFLNALEQPEGSPPLKALFSPGDSVLLVLPDKQRKYHCSRILPLLLNHLNSIGIPDDRTGILFGGGTHIGMTREEMEQVAGSEALSRVRFWQHDCDDQEQVILIGETTRGTKVFINQRVKEFERIVSVGGVIPHHFAGFTGGRKLFLPAICSRQTIMANHRHSLHPSLETMSPDARQGVLEGNPVHEDMMEALDIVKPAFAINLLFNGEGEIARIIAGDPEKSHGMACQFLRDKFFPSLPRKADLIITSPGGYPKDLTLPQAYKALTGAWEIVKKGGAILFLAELREKFGFADYQSWLDCTSIEAVVKRMRKEYQVSARCILVSRVMAQEIDIAIFSQLDPSAVSSLGFQRISTRDEIQNYLSSHCKPNDLIYVLPQGGTLYPTIIET